MTQNVSDDVVLSWCHVVCY